MDKKPSKLKIRKVKCKRITISELCGEKSGSFRKFLKEYKKTEGL